MTVTLPSVAFTSNTALSLRLTSSVRMSPFSAFSRISDCAFALTFPVWIFPFFVVSRIFDCSLALTFPVRIFPFFVVSRISDCAFALTSPETISPSTVLTSSFGLSVLWVPFTEILSKLTLPLFRIFRVIFALSLNSTLENSTLPVLTFMSASALSLSTESLNNTFPLKFTYAVPVNSPS